MTFLGRCESSHSIREGGSGMKISYDREDDIMLLEVSAEQIDFAEEMGPIIVHFNKGRKPVLLEILDASEFIAAAAKSTIRARDSQPVEVNY
jgi:uncharacterized protein YuzE